MSTYNLGRILSVYRGNYDSATTYKPLDLVYTEGGTYVAKQTVTGIAPTADTTDYWQVVSKNITNEEIRELYEADEATRNARLTAFIGEASQTLEDLEASLTASVNNAIAPIATTLTNITATVEAGEQERNNKVDNLLEETTNAFEQAESNRENTLTNAITTINNNDTVFKTQLQSSVNTWLNEKGVEFSEAQQERATEFNAQEASRAGRFSTQLNSQATAFNSQQTQQTTDFTNSQNSRTTTFTASEQERANIFAQTEAQREADIEIIAQEAERLTNLEETKANKDGYYIEFTAGMAEQLLSPDGIIDSEPYLYRTSAGSTSISTGVAQVEKLEGNSIIFNQLSNLPQYYSKPMGTTYTDTLVNVPYNGTVDHKYYISVEVENLEEVDYRYNYIVCIVNDRYSQPSLTQNGSLFYGIFNCKPYQFSQFYIRFNSNNTEDVFNFKNTQIIDLTKMFGAGNEPTVEQFKQWFPKDYYTYNTGEIINVNIDGLKTVGFNQWDEEWESGQYDSSNGGKTANNTRIRCKDYIRVFPNTYYTHNKKYELVVNFFDINKNIIQYNQAKSGDAVVVNKGADAYTWCPSFKTPSNCAYIVFFVVNCPTYNNDIAINIEWSGYRNGDYEPYTEHNINIPVKEIKDADNNLLFSDGLKGFGNFTDEVTSDKAVKRYKKTTLHKEWINQFIEGYFSNGDNLIYAENIKSYITDIGGEGIPIINTNFTPCVGASGWSSLTTESVGSWGANTLQRLAFRTKMTKTQFDSVIDGLEIYYITSTPIEVEFKNVPQSFGEKLNLTYFVDDFGTEEFTTDITGLVAPVAHQTKYLDNLVDKIRTINGNTATACITNAGIDNLITTLGNAIGFTITKAWDTTNKCWTFTATQNNTDNNL